MYNVNDFRGRKSGTTLIPGIARHGYAIAGIVCSNEAILNTWKWALAAALPVKVLISTKTGIGSGSIARMVRTSAVLKYRAGFADAGIVRAFARIVIFPFTLSYLLLYAAAAHFRRALYRGFR